MQGWVWTFRGPRGPADRDPPSWDFLLHVLGVAADLRVLGGSGAPTAAERCRAGAPPRPAPALAATAAAQLQGAGATRAGSAVQGHLPPAAGCRGVPRPERAPGPAGCEHPTAARSPGPGGASTPLQAVGGSVRTVRASGRGRRTAGTAWGPWRGPGKGCCQDPHGWRDARPDPRQPCRVPPETVPGPLLPVPLGATYQPMEVIQCDRHLSLKCAKSGSECRNPPLPLKRIGLNR